MEEILPEVDKVVIEPGAASVVPLIPMTTGQGRPSLAPSAPPSSEASR